MRWERAFEWASQHPVAWTPARWDEDACRWDDADVWTSGTDGASIEVVLLDGATGAIEETVPIEGVASDMEGLFAAAVDANGDFWGAQLGGGSLVHVTRDDFEVRTHPLPITAYGVVVDHEGFVWTCWQDAARFERGCVEQRGASLRVDNQSAVRADSQAHVHRRAGFP